MFLISNLQLMLQNKLRIKRSTQHGDSSLNCHASPTNPVSLYPDSEQRLSAEHLKTPTSPSTADGGLQRSRRASEVSPTDTEVKVTAVGSIANEGTAKSPTHV